MSVDDLRTHADLLNEEITEMIEVLHAEDDEERLARLTMLEVFYQNRLDRIKSEMRKLKNKLHMRVSRKKNK